MGTIAWWIWNISDISYWFIWWGVGNQLINIWASNNIVWWNNNTIEAASSNIVGGNGNSVGWTTQSVPFWSSIVGGQSNTITGSTNTMHLSFIGWGWVNVIDNNASASSIVWGIYNQLNAWASAIVGGENNLINIDGIQSTIAGGIQNTINQGLSFIGWGQDNLANARWSVIGWGKNNIIHQDNNPDPNYRGSFNTIAGGEENQITGFHNGVLAWFRNLINAKSSSVMWGFENTIEWWASTIIWWGNTNTAENAWNSAIIAGYNNNLLWGNWLLIWWGQNNTIDQANGMWRSANSSIVWWAMNYLIGGVSSIVWGSNNLVNGSFGMFIGWWTNNSISWNLLNLSSIVWGWENIITDDASASSILWGVYNAVHARASAIVGGETNVIFSWWIQSTIVGWLRNTINQWASVIGGGIENTISTRWSVIGGWEGNTIFDTGNPDPNYRGSFNSIGWWRFNEITGLINTIAGGLTNNIVGDYSFIWWGQDNNINWGESNIIGWWSNNIEGTASTIMWWMSNSIIWNNSLVWWRNAHIAANDTFLWSASNTPGVANIDETFIIYAANGVGINTNTPSKALDVNGAIVSSAMFIDAQNYPGNASLSVQSVNTIFVDTSLTGINIVELTDGTVGQVVRIVKQSTANVIDILGWPSALTNEFILPTQILTTLWKEYVFDGNYRYSIQ
jgi:hypothetical protein